MNHQVEKISAGLRSLLISFAAAILMGCGSSDESGWSTHLNDYLSFQLPSDWEAVPDRRGQLFAPEDERHEQYQIEVRASHNPRIGPRKIRETWLGMRDRSERVGLLIAAQASQLNGFERFDLVSRAPAPSVELIPAEYQVSGDQIYHQVMLISPQNLSVTARLLVEEAQYDEYLAIFERTLNSISPLVQP